MGMRPWGYMHAGAMEVGVLQRAVKGMRTVRTVHEEAMEVEAARGLTWE